MPKRVSEMTFDQEIRFPTGLAELDRVLGGGAVQGSLVLIGGAPGIGKSTLMLQICQQLCQFAKVLYVSGEESERQLKPAQTGWGWGRWTSTSLLRAAWSRSSLPLRRRSPKL